MVLNFAERKTICIMYANESPVKLIADRLNIGEISVQLFIDDYLEGTPAIVMSAIKQYIDHNIPSPEIAKLTNKSALFIDKIRTCMGFSTPKLPAISAHYISYIIQDMRNSKLEPSDIMRKYFISYSSTYRLLELMKWTDKGQKEDDVPKYIRKSMIRKYIRATKEISEPIAENGNILTEEMPEPIAENGNIFTEDVGSKSASVEQEGSKNILIEHILRLSGEGVSCTVDGNSCRIQIENKTYLFSVEQLFVIAKMAECLKSRGETHDI